MYLINNLEFNKEKEDWVHTSTRVISTCFNKKEAQEKLNNLDIIKTPNYRSEYELQRI